MLDESDIILIKEDDRTFYDCKISNENLSADIALVGLCPGYNQLSEILKSDDIDSARHNASFKGSTKNIARMLRKIRIDALLKIKILDDYDFNKSKYFFTTSLVIYPGLKEGKGRSDDFNPLKYSFAKECIEKIFLKDILKCKAKIVVIFGKKAQAAVQQYKLKGNTVENLIKKSGKEIIYLPHPSGSNNGGVARFLRE